MLRALSPLSLTRLVRTPGSATRSACSRTPRLGVFRVGSPGQVRTASQEVNHLRARFIAPAITGWAGRQFGQPATATTSSTRGQPGGVPQDPRSAVPRACSQSGNPRRPSRTCGSLSKFRWAEPSGRPASIRISFAPLQRPLSGHAALPPTCLPEVFNDPHDSKSQ